MHYHRCCILLCDSANLAISIAHVPLFHLHVPQYAYCETITLSIFQWSLFINRGWLYGYLHLQFVAQVQVEFNSVCTWGVCLQIGMFLSIATLPLCVHYHSVASTSIDTVEECDACDYAWLGIYELETRP